MARTVLYHLNSPQTTSLAGAATIQAIQPGRIVGVKIMVSSTGGASAGFYNISVDLNNQSQLFQSVNNPPREIILDNILFATIITSSASLATPCTPLSVPLRVGDIISLNVALSGTAATAMNINANVWVMENGG